MSSYAKILSLSYDSAEATKSTALKSYWRSVRLIKEAGTVNPEQPSYTTNILLNGKCVDPETRKLYVAYIDTSVIGSAWIIEIDIDTRVQTVVYYDKYNAIGFNHDYKIYNMRVVHGRLVLTDNLNPIYQIDIARAKRSFYHKIGYGQYPNTTEWSAIVTYGIDQIVSNGNNLYKSLIYTNLNNEPRLGDGTKWKKLCLIEDAYYSMNIENFYFEPVPPKHPPTLEYQSDDTRKINNLRQTLFQVAYLYVYMDWRKSTYSPASIVPVPQAEEETATGLANEQISLNNKLQIIVNSGGEEVRAIEVIGRSSQDPSKWFLIETISKFEEQGRGNEISRTTEPANTPIGMAVQSPTVVIESSFAAPATPPMQVAIFSPNIILSWISATDLGLGWTDVQSTETIETTEIISSTNSAYDNVISYIPDWIIIRHTDADGYELTEGMTVQNGEIFAVSPRAVNLGALKVDVIKVENIYGDSVAILATHQAFVAPIELPMNPTIAIDPLDTSGLILDPASIANCHSGAMDINISFKVDHPGIPGTGTVFTLYWRIIVNGFEKGIGSFDNIQDNVGTTRGVYTNEYYFLITDAIFVYLSADYIALPTSSSAKIDMGLSIPTQKSINSWIARSVGAVGFAATGYVAATSDITAPPLNCYITALPLDGEGNPWVTVTGPGGYSLGLYGLIQNGTTINIIPSSDNLGGARSGYIQLANIYGDTSSIFVSQLAALVPPAGVPVSCTILLFPGDVSGMAITGSTTSALSDDTIVPWTGNIIGLIGTTIYWKAYKAGSAIVQGSGSFDAHNGPNYGSLALDNVLLPGDVITIYFSSADDIIGIGDTPLAPVATAATVIFGEGFTANWMVSYSATGYYLDVSTSNTFETFVTGYNNLDVGNVLTKAITGLNASTSYYYRVRAYKTLSVSPSSNVITVATLGGPSVPAAQAATQLVKDGFLANWFASVPNISGYKLDVSRNSSFTDMVVGYNNLDVVGLSQAVTGLAASTIYYYRVRSYDTYGVYSGYSITIIVTTLALNVPAIPVAIAATNITINSFTANWNASVGATGYRIDVSLVYNFSSFIGIYNNLNVGDVTSLNITGLSPYQLYYYRVRAYNADGTSSSSASISVTTPAPPAPTITLSPSAWTFAGVGIANKKAVTVTINNATSWGINFPSSPDTIKLYGYLSTYVVELYYNATTPTMAALTFWATGPGGTVTTIFRGGI